MNRLIPTAFCLLALAALPVRSSAAEEKISFQGKAITMVIPTTPAGSTDLAARLLAKYFSKHLPGEPTVVATNQPGGHGIAALNYMAQQAKLDGLTVTISSNSQIDPITFRTPQARYDPRNFAIVGSMGLGDNVMIIRTDALPRLLDKSAQPVAMGSVSGQPRSGMQMTLWGHKYLGWNTRWVVGYPGSTDLMLAIERGEVDMSAFPRSYVIDKLTDPGKFKVLYLDGLEPDAPKSGRADSDNAPLFTEAMRDKVADPKMRAAYEYWRASKLFKWVALPPKTPEPIVAAYRAAFERLMVDPEFLQQAKNTLESFYAIPAEKTIALIRAMAETPDEAIESTKALMLEQGLGIDSK